MKIKTTTRIIYTVLCSVALVCFIPLFTAYAVNPPPDGGYPGFTTAEGTNALKNLTTGVGNTATGWHSLFANTAGNLNTNVGAGTLLFNAGDNNRATGALALLNNTSGFYNTADGAFALLSNTVGSGNTAGGYQALYSNNEGNNNAAYGYIALRDNTGSFNTGFGSQALVRNLVSNNTAVGYQALVFNIAGDQNTACGAKALLSDTIGYYNIALGYSAGVNTAGDANIDIGNQGFAGESQTIRIGQTGVHTATYIAGIAGQTVGAGGSTCYVDNDGKLGVFLSARRYKENIHPMDNASEALYALKPVTFRYKPEYDKSGTPQFGLVAEEVVEVSPDLVTHDAKDELSTVRYDAVNAMLLNEFLKAHRKVQKQEATIALLKSTDAKQEAIIAKQQKQIEALTAGLQKVNAQLELRKAEQEVAVNSP